MSLLQIEKYDRRTIEENIPDEYWEQVDNNLISIGCLLYTIGSLKEGESITITKKVRNKNEI